MRQNRFTLIYILTVILCLSFSSMALGAEQESVVITLSASDEDNKPLTSLPAVGETVNVDIGLRNSGTEGVYGLQVQLNYDPEYLEPTQAQLDPGMVWEGQYIAKNNVDQSHGKVYFVATFLGSGDGIVDQQAIAALQFKVKKACNTETAISIAAADSANGTVLSNNSGQQLSWQAENCTLLGKVSSGSGGGSSSSGGSGSPQAMTKDVLVIDKEDVQKLTVNNQVLINLGKQQLSMSKAAVQLALTTPKSEMWPLQIVTDYGKLAIGRQSLEDLSANEEIENLDLYLRPATSLELPKAGKGYGTPIQLVSNLTGKVRLTLAVSSQELTTSAKFWGVWFETEADKGFVAGNLSDVADGTKQIVVLLPSNFQASKMVFIPEFVDLEKHWAKPQMEHLAYLGIIKGTGNGLVLPDNKVTRAEFAAMLVRALSLQGSVPKSAGFTDVPTTAWYARDIALAYEAGIITGSGNNTFAPQALITREEMAVMIARAYQQVSKQELAGGHIDFKDTALISDWAQVAVTFCVEQDFVSGNGNSCFEPQVPATRAQATVMLYQLLNSEEVKSCLENNW